MCVCVAPDATSRPHASFLDQGQWRFRWERRSASWFLCLAGTDTWQVALLFVVLWTQDNRGAMESKSTVFKLQGLTHLFKGVFAIGLELQLREELRESNRRLTLTAETEEVFRARPDHTCGI